MVISWSSPTPFLNTPLPRDFFLPGPNGLISCPFPSPPTTLRFSGKISPPPRLRKTSFFGQFPRLFFPFSLQPPSPHRQYETPSFRLSSSKADVPYGGGRAPPQNLCLFLFTTTALNDLFLRDTPFEFFPPLPHPLKSTRIYPIFFF